jgi:LysR family transcriptional regulator for bpeEF and oprC
MDLFRCMQTFVQVAEAGSFRRAAKALKLSPGMVSTHVAQLEQRLDILLIDRKARGLALTEHGASYLEHCRRILDEVRETEGQLTETTLAPRGHLRVEVAATTSRALLVPILAEFCARYPDISLELIHTEHVRNSAYEGFDVMLRLGPLEDSSLIARPLGSMERWTVAAPDYLVRHGSPVIPEDLRQHRCINYIDPRSGRAGHWTFERDGHQIDLQLRSSLAFNEAGPRFEAAVHGLGIIQTTSIHVAPLVANRQLCRILEDWTAMAPPLLVLYPRRQYPSAKLRAFVDFLLEKYPAGRGMRSADGERCRMNC